jgi:hypothetical protein
LVTKLGIPWIVAMLMALPTVVALRAVDASAAEICRYTGSTDYDGRVAVTTDVTESDGITRIDVAGDFEATTMLWFRIHYLLEEVSTWRDGELQSVSMNSRYLLGDHIVRQSWDDFRRGGDGLQAYRVQGKTLADFRLKHPGFARHWDPATFGQPWLRDYPSAPPERRADLDLANAPAGLRSPLALAFYWIRWLPRGEQTVPVFLPGFKKEPLVELPIAGVPSSSGTLLRAPLRHPAFNETPVSFATARISADRHLLQLAVEVHGSSGSGRGLITEDGCDGKPVVPANRRP